ncbi:DUF2332 domain-containing protein [Kitasatospora sp. NPDC092948]|uniref:DUF2332 domain-containing protein n=1 Tax=Kitasatospora sp. NPDC092948 TaxID=3364088 RepID=UPI0038221A11
MRELIDRPELLRSMAGRSAKTAPVAAGLLAKLADDIERDGPVTRLIGGHPQAGAPLFGIRALAGVQGLLTAGRLPELAALLDGSGAADGLDPRGADRPWELFVRAIADHPAEIAAALDNPVQQHEPVRAAALVHGLALLRAPRIRLLELGACAGLNLLIDRYRWFGPDWEWGDPDSPVRLPAFGPDPGDVRIVARAGCDLRPRNPADPTDARIVRSYLPFEHAFLHATLDDALGLAARVPVRVEQADAVDWLRRELAVPTDPAVRTVVWHSLFWEFLDAGRQDALEQIMTDAAATVALTRIAFEPYHWTMPPRLQLTQYS